VREKRRKEKRRMTDEGINPLSGKQKQNGAEDEREEKEGRIYIVLSISEKERLGTERGG